MSFSDEYFKLRNKRKKEEQTTTNNNSFANEYSKLKANRTAEEQQRISKAEQNSALAWRDDEIAPVRTDRLADWREARDSAFLTQKKNENAKGGNKDSFFKSGGFSDGVDGVGDFLVKSGYTVGGTVGDVGVGFAKGMTRTFEGVGDLVAYGVAGVADAFGADKFAEETRRVAKESQTDDMFGKTSNFFDQYSVLGNKADAVSEGLGQVATVLLTGGAASAAGLGSVGVTAVTTGVTGLSGTGSGMSEAYESGASDEDAFKYGLAKGAIEAGTELLFGGLGKASKAVGIGKSAIPLDDILAKTVTKKITSQTAKNLVQYGIKASAEGVEEVIAGYLTAHAKKGTYMPEEDFSKILEDENLLESFIVGTLTSAISQSGYVPAMQNGSLRESIKTGRDFITGYTQNEQSVIDKEVENRVAEQEKNGKKLTKREIGKIEEQVQNDLDKGYISIDTIESTLGGKTFEEYKSIADKEKNLTDEISQLEGLPDNQITVKQRERLTAARKELEGINKTELKTRLNDEVFSLVKDSRLAESYNEKARRGQAFEADLSQYDEKQRVAVERAIKSGVLNNTNRSHELVNILSKIEADKGIVFDYTDNAKLKESGFALEGKTVNGFVKNGNVTLNVQSQKAWQSTVGHEITHILEGTDSYGALQEALFKHAESKGELESRKTALTELYKDMDADIDAELTADLVGDYLFTDKNFINNLTGNRTLFQKVYDEIKYLCKVATGKEKTDIEKVREEFDKAWKEMSVNANTETDGKTKYSIVALDNGSVYVQASRNVIKGTTVDEMRNDISLFFSNLLEGNSSIDIPTINGDVLTITKAETADKARDNYRVVNGKRIKMTNEEFAVKLRVESHIDEVAETSTQINKKSDTKDHSFAKDGFTYRKAYFEDFDGQYYEVTLSIGNNGTVATVYNVGKIKESVLPSAKILAVVGSKPLGKTLSENGIPQNSNDVKTKFSISENTQGKKLSAEQQVYFKEAKTVDGNGRLKPFYHGTARADRVGTVFRPDRATSGPMAFFTDNQEIADNYARDKKDTSLAYDTDYDSYETQFRVNRNGKDMSVVELWNTLSISERNAIKEKAKHITMDDDWENVVYSEDAQYGLGNFDAYELNAHKGNALHTLVDSWLTDGNIYGEEHKFLDVLKLVGIDDAKYMNPDFRAEKTYAVYLNITNPFDTSNISPEMVEALKKAAEDVEFVEGNSADMWDKNNISPEKWIERLEYDIENGTTHCWTSIPDFVTNVLKAHGYDGIFDTGGKNGGTTHTVAIPFYSEQIKDVDNLNPTKNPDITLSLSNNGDQFAPIGNYSTPINETALAPTREDIAKMGTVSKSAAKVENAVVDDAPFFTEYDAPPVMEDTYYEDNDTTALDNKALKNIGKSLRDTLALTAQETKAIQEIVQEYSTSETKNTNTLFDTIKEKFGEKVWKVKSEEIAEVKRFLRDTKVNVSPYIKSSIADYSAFRKSIGGKVGISKDGLPVDTAYQQLVEMYPAFFSEEITNEADQFLRMVEVANTELYETESYQLDDNTIQEAVNIISNEVKAYKQNLTRIAAEETAREALDSIAPLRVEQLADGSRGDALLIQSLDNFPIKTVADRLKEKIRAVQGELDDNKVLRRETTQDYNKQIAELQEELNSKKNKNTKTAINIAQRISRLQKRWESIDANFAKHISDLEARVEKMQDPQYSRAMYKQDKMQEHAKWAENLLGDTSTWVDKKTGLQYETNTERRNLRDIVRDKNGNMDIAKADAIDDALNGQYNREEAAKKRELAQIRKKYADLKITKAEDAYIQMLGELRGNPDTTLTEKVVNEYYEAHKNKIDKAKVEKALEFARQDYDNLLKRVNEVLKAQGMKEIPYRKGYFPHFTEPKQNFIQKLLNWKTQDNEIPTSIAGLTEDFKPVKKYQSFDKQRHGDTTDYSFTKGFDNYSEGALDWAHHLDTLQKRRAVENYIRYTHSDEGIEAKIKEVYANEEYDAEKAQAKIEQILTEAQNPLNNFVQDFMTKTNILAGKKNTMDRGTEKHTNRKIYSIMTNVQNRMSANMVLANVRSALTNFIPITQSWAQVSPMRSLQATKDTIANAIKDDGVIDKSTFLTNRLREVDNLYNTAWDKVLDKAGIMFEIVDNFSSQVIWRSKYNQNLANGMTESQAIKNADQFAENVMAGRSKGNEPTLFNAKNPLVKAFTMFQLEVNNQYGYLFKDVPNDLKAETNHWKLNLAKGYTTAFIGAYVYNALLEQVAGSGAALDPIGIIEDLLKDLGLFGDDEEEESLTALINFGENIGEELPFIGGTVFGGGRIPISSALPYKDEGLIGGVKAFADDISNWNDGGSKNFDTELQKPFFNLVLPVGGGQIKKTYQGLSMFNTDEDHPIAGSYTDSSALRFPVEDTLGNRIQAGIFGQYASKNAREYFDNGYAPLQEKQIQEYTDVDLPIADYWKYREGLKGLKTNAEKADYINSLDIKDWQKNLLMNNILDRKEDVDMSNYDNYANFEEFDFAQKNPEKYEFFKANGISYSDYANADEDGKNAYTWAYNNPEKYKVSKVVANNVIEYRSYTSDLYDIKADKDAYGETIVGSGKEKKIEYINNLDLDYGQKIVLFKMQYKSDDTYNADIIEYINNLDNLTYEERVTIYTELGFTVKDGYVYWD